MPRIPDLPEILAGNIDPEMDYFWIDHGSAGVNGARRLNFAQLALLVGAVGAGNLTASKTVANAAARLALSSLNAAGFAVVDADTGKTWMLVSGGNPATSGDWLQLGDRDMRAADIADATPAGRSLLTAADLAAIKSLLGLQGSNTGDQDLSAYATLSGAQTLSDKTLVNFREGVLDIGNSGTAKALAINTATVQQVGLNGNCVFTMPPVVAGKSFRLDVIGTGVAHTATFTGVEWSAGINPQINTALGFRNTFIFTTNVAGTVWIGVLVGTAPAPTTESVLALLDGSGGRIGNSRMPNALSGVGDPNKSRMLIGGTLSPDIARVLIYAGLNGGQPHWTSNGLGYDVNFGNGAFTYLMRVGPEWWLGAKDVNNYEAYIAEVVAVGTYPDGLTGWNITFGTGQPTVNAGALATSYIGQEYHDITDPDNVIVWFWNGSAWQSSGVVTIESLTALATASPAEFKSLLVSLGCILNE